MNKKTFPKKLNDVAVRYIADLGDGRHRIGIMGTHKKFIIGYMLDIPAHGKWMVEKTYNHARQADIFRLESKEKKK